YDIVRAERREKTLKNENAQLQERIERETEQYKKEMTDREKASSERNIIKEVNDIVNAYAMRSQRVPNTIVVDGRPDRPKSTKRVPRSQKPSFIITNINTAVAKAKVKAKSKPKAKAKA